MQSPGNRLLTRAAPIGATTVGEVIRVYDNSDPESKMDVRENVFEGVKSICQSDLQPNLASQTRRHPGVPCAIHSASRESFAYSDSRPSCSLPCTRRFTAV